MGMAAPVFVMIMLAMFSGSDAAWCICRPDVSQTVQQRALDYACGAGADCNPILQNGACYQPNTVVNHCSYAANSYYQRKGQAQGACDFSGAAMLVSSDPSSAGCTYPASPSAAGTSGSTSTGTPGSSTTPTTPSTLSPNTGTGTGTGIGAGTGTGTGAGTGTGTGITGTGLGGLGPSGFSPDGSDGGFIPKARLVSLLLTLFFPGLILLGI